MLMTSQPALANHADSDRVENRGPSITTTVPPSWIGISRSRPAPTMVDRTRDRPNTFYDGPVTTHISFADPYCPVMRDATIAAGREQGIPLHERGTVVVIEGPRFSTRAESSWFASAGWEVINMTQYPECVLARELELCYANISLITDYDVGVEGVPPVTNDEVVRVFAENNEKLRDLLFAVIPALPEERDCPCATALTGARFEV